MKILVALYKYQFHHIPEKAALWISQTSSLDQEDIGLERHYGGFSLLPPERWG